jgi:hypothetical protein
MRCPNCGAGISSSLCLYCGTGLLSREEKHFVEADKRDDDNDEEVNLAQTEEKQARLQEAIKLRKQIDYFEHSGAPKSILRKKLKLLHERLQKLES